MKANINQWYVQWFFWNCRALDNFTNREFRHQTREEKYSTGINLCEFFRVLLFGTLVAVASVATVIHALFVVLVLPFLLFDAVSVLVTVGIGISFIVFGSGFLALLFSAPIVAEWVRDRITSLTPDTSSERPGFFRVVWQYLVGIKQKFCPIITFKED